MTVLPLGIYIYLNEDVQTTLKANIDYDLDKYIIEAELLPDENTIAVFQKIMFENKMDRSLEKIYMIAYPNHIEIEKLLINKEKVSFKVIGKDKNLIMILPHEKIQQGEVLSIELSYKVNMKRFYDDIDMEKYILRDWYPIIPPLNEKGWTLESSFSKGPYEHRRNYSIKIVLPGNYIIDNGVNALNTSKIDEKRKVYYLQGVKSENISLIIEKYNKNKKNE